MKAQHDTLKSCSNVIREMYAQIDTRLAQADPFLLEEPKRIKYQEYTIAINKLAALLAIHPDNSAA